VTCDLWCDVSRRLLCRRRSLQFQSVGRKHRPHTRSLQVTPHPAPNAHTHARAPQTTSHFLYQSLWSLQTVYGGIWYLHPRNHSSNLTHHTSHLTPHTPHLTHHTSLLAPHTTHHTPRTTHLTPRTSHLTRLQEIIMSSCAALITPTS
jgi:hypothetical protein